MAYSELADPVEQRRRLVQQSIAAAKGDPEAMRLDEDFLRALEYGMPPISDDAATGVPEVSPREPAVPGNTGPMP